MYNLGIQPQMNTGFNQPFNPYDFQSRYSPQSQNGLIRVTGIEGAKAYQMTPNCSVALFDNNEDFFYVKTTDGAGFPTIRTFRFEEVQNNTESQPINNYVTREELEDYVKQFIQSNSSTKQVSTTNAASKSSKAESRSSLQSNDAN